MFSSTLLQLSYLLLNNFVKNGFLSQKIMLYFYALSSFTVLFYT